MVEDTAPDGGAEADRPADLLTRVLAESDLTEEELTDRLLALTDAMDPEADTTVVEPARVEEHEEQIGALETQLEALEEEFQAKIEDLRKRLIQVKRLTDTKAPDDHGHDEFEAVASQLDELAAEISDVESRFEAGFENYESILEYLSGSLDTVNERLPVLAEAVVTLRDEVDMIVEQATYQERLTSLTETANNHGIRRARCDSCSGKIDLSLLQEPRCPHCQSVFAELDANTGFFGTHTLSVEAAPALEGETVDRTELGSILDSEPRTPPEQESPPDIGSVADEPASRTAESGSEVEDGDSDGFVFGDT